MDVRSGMQMTKGSAAVGRVGFALLLWGALAGARAEGLVTPPGGWSDVLGPGGAAVFPTADTVLVRVNGKPIIAQYLDDAMARQDRYQSEAEASGKRTKAERKSREAMLELLIDTTLQAQRAFELGLDKSPDGSAAPDGQAFDVALRRYYERVIADVQPPDKAEISAYYDSHPPLFSRRRIYDFREIVAEVPQRDLAQTKERIKRVKTVNELQTMLVKRGQLGQMYKATRAAEQLPLAQIDNFHSMKAGQVTISPDAKGLRILILERVENKPVTLEQAAPAIEAFIHNERRRVALDADLLALRKAAVIEYIGAQPPAQAKQP